VGAIYLDKGYAAADAFITKSILVTFKDILKTGSWLDAKSHLQEVAQSKEGFTPVYKVLSEDGPDHDKTFTVGVFINGRLRGKGVGPSKQAGQQQAAETALRSLSDDQPKLPTSD
jgi:ribonuclease-3